MMTRVIRSAIIAYDFDTHAILRQQHMRFNIFADMPLLYILRLLPFLYFIAYTSRWQGLSRRLQCRRVMTRFARQLCATPTAILLISPTRPREERGIS